MSDGGDVPGNVRPLPRRGSPFGALVAAACAAAGAAEGLASAYVAMNPAARRRMVDVVAEDARAEGAAPAVALAPLLGVEEDPAIAQAIFDAMRSDEGQGLDAASDARALVAGTGERGAAALVRPLYGRFVEVLGLAWDQDGVTGSCFEPLVEDQDVERHLVDLPRAGELEGRPFALGLQRVVEALWRHRRRHGHLPQGLAPFADLL